ncbi:MAG TPA: hypothetical protein ENJ40_02030 [Thermosulfurimonas dismutans]|uniref:Uncharacterized protein n=1 Tax=Thermosulfurimonas dismutans TaxID=999894 RepID=A0A7C3GT97_9BACT|nr:hypothetical protein [Thermosulfurimonas dismutans]
MWAGKYRGYLIWWGPLAVTLILCVLLWIGGRPRGPRAPVPALPSIYREIPETSPERIRYVPAGPLHTGAFGKTSAGSTSSKPVSRRSYELKAVLRIGARRLCKFGPRTLTEGDRLGPFRILKIGENYVELQGKGKIYRVFVGESVVF